jgi:hypothetical protein
MTVYLSTIVHCDPQNVLYTWVCRIVFCQKVTFWRATLRLRHRAPLALARANAAPLTPPRPPRKA